MSDESKQRIAEGPSCSIDLCGCGVLHVSFGPITLRLQADAVRSMHVTLGEALRQLEVEALRPGRGASGAHGQSLS